GAEVERENVVGQISVVDDSREAPPRNDLKVAVPVVRGVGIVEVREAVVLELDVVLARDVDDRIVGPENGVDRNLKRVVLIGKIGGERVVRAQRRNRSCEEVGKAGVV